MSSEELNNQSSDAQEESQEPAIASDRSEDEESDVRNDSEPEDQPGPSTSTNRNLRKRRKRFSESDSSQSECDIGKKQSPKKSAPHTRKKRKANFVQRKKAKLKPIVNSSVSEHHSSSNNNDSSNEPEINHKPSKKLRRMKSTSSSVDTEDHEPELEPESTVRKSTRKKKVGGK